MIGTYQFRERNQDLKEQNQNLENKIENIKNSNYEITKYFSEETQRVILNSKKENMSIKELNKLLENKVINKKSSSPLPYLCCPKCGGDLDRSSSTYKGTTHFFCSCKECDWTMST